MSDGAYECESAVRASGPVLTSAIMAVLNHSAFPRPFSPGISLFSTLSFFSVCGSQIEKRTYGRKDPQAEIEECLDSKQSNIVNIVNIENIVNIVNTVNYLKK